MYRESAERAASMLLRYKDCIRRYKSRTEDRGRKFKVLGSLREYEMRNGSPVTVSEISRDSGLAMPNVSRLLKPFERDGLIRREKRGRTVYVTITPKGNEVLEAQREIFISDIAAALGILTDAERDAFLSAGEKILQALENNPEILSAGDNRC